MSLKKIKEQKSISTIILEEELIDRRSETYTLFEDKIIELTQKNGNDDKSMIEDNFEEIAYLFSQQCYYRDFIQSYSEEIEEDIAFDEPVSNNEVNLGILVEAHAANSVKKNLEKFFDLDIELFEYFWSLSNHIYQNEFSIKYETDPLAYKIINNISKEDLIRELGSKRIEEIFTQHEMFSNTFEIESFISKLDEEEKGRLAGLLRERHNKKLNTSLKTYIMKNEKRIYINDTSPKTAMIELDLSKSKKQILKYVEHLIDEHKNKSFSLMHEMLGALDIKTKSMENFIKTPKDIPLCANLTDYLFIYDSYKSSISIRETQANINNYYYDFYDKEENSISKGTIDNRLKDIRDYMENKKYTLYYTVEFANIEPPIESIIEEAEDRYWSQKYS